MENKSKTCLECIKQSECEFEEDKIYDLIKCNRGTHLPTNSAETCFLYRPKSDYKMVNTGVNS
ncbi:MAG: hypothetical protein AABW91_00575 [Nanoarchaeota archaeon]